MRGMIKTRALWAYRSRGCIYIYKFKYAANYFYGGLYCTYIYNNNNKSRAYTSNERERGVALGSLLHSKRVHCEGEREMSFYWSCCFLYTGLFARTLCL